MGLLDIARQYGLLSDPMQGVGLMDPLRNKTSSLMNHRLLPPAPMGANMLNPTLGDSLMFGMNALPGAGDALSAVDAVDQYKQGNMFQSALAGVGALPGIPSLAGLGSKAAAMPLLGAMTAYHGSPHKFDKFDMSKIGTGEGAQAYGHGLYFAETPEVAKGYQQRLSGSNPILFELGGEKVGYIGDGKKALHKKAIEMGYSPESIALFANELYESKGVLDDVAGKLGWLDNPLPVHEEAARLARSIQYIPDGGAIYTVDLPDDQIAKMLDWDKPLSEQPESVRKALEAIAPKPSKVVEIKNNYGGMKYSHFVMEDSPQIMFQGRASAEKAAAEIYAEKMKDFNRSGANLYRSLAGKLDNVKASEKLKELGIPGIKYLDGTSRKAGEGTRNFVVFDDSIVKILDKK